MKKFLPGIRFKSKMHIFPAVFMLILFLFLIYSKVFLELEEEETFLVMRVFMVEKESTFWKAVSVIVPIIFIFCIFDGLTKYYYYDENYLEIHSVGLVPIKIPLASIWRIMYASWGSYSVWYEKRRILLGLTKKECRLFCDFLQSKNPQCEVYL